MINRSRQSQGPPRFHAAHSGGAIASEQLACLAIVYAGATGPPSTERTTGIACPGVRSAGWIPRWGASSRRWRKAIE